MPVPKTGALPLGDSPIPVSSPADGSENRRAATERREVLGTRERRTREDTTARFGPQCRARAIRFPLAFKDSEDARTAAREQRPDGARFRERFPRAADFWVEPRHDDLEIVRPDSTVRNGKIGFRARNR